MAEPSTERGLRLSCWYVHLRRVTQLLDRPDLTTPALSARDLTSQVDHLVTLRYYAAVERALVQWLHAARLPSLGELLRAGPIAPGTVFTHYGLLFFRGLREYAERLERAKLVPPSNPPAAYAKLDDFGAGTRLEMNYYPEHLLNQSAWSELSGQRTLLLLGVAESDVTTGGVRSVRALPCVIATPMLASNVTGLAAQFGWAWQRGLEIFLQQISSFERVRDVPSPTPKHLARLRDVSEDSVKRAVADIVGEPYVPKDWGGERSDLLTSRVQIGEDRVVTAFAFKGPAKFHPLTLADLGKNGDQIERLFSEEADLVVLQHCHQITGPVRSHMRAFATRFGRERLFCLVDGADTVRLLRAYGKCGFQTPRKAAT